MPRTPSGQHAVGDVQAAKITPAGPSHPTTIMRLSALAETEGIVCPAGRGLRLEAQPASQKGRIVLGNSLAWGCHPTRHNKLRPGEGTAALEDRAPRPRRGQGRDRKQELWGNLNNSELRVHFQGPGGRAPENLQPGCLSKRPWFRAGSVGSEYGVKFCLGRFLAECLGAKRSMKHSSFTP